MAFSGAHVPLSPPPPSIGSGTVGRRFNITAKIELICLTRPSIRSGSLFQHNKMNNTVLTKNVKALKTALTVGRAIIGTLFYGMSLQQNVIKGKMGYNIGNI